MGGTSTTSRRAARARCRPLPSKAELLQYTRELVEAKSDLRDHFRHGAFAGVKAHYGYR
jgi:hypothetical protein